MDDKQQHVIQQQVIDYFKNHDNSTFIAFVESFVYHKPAKNESISRLIEQFVADNGLTDAYVNTLMDLRDEDKSFFKRSSFSQRVMIDAVTSALMNAAFNRFRRLVK